MPKRHISYQTLEKVAIDEVPNSMVRLTFETRRLGYYQVDYIDDTGLAKVKGEPQLANFTNSDIDYMEKIGQIALNLIKHGPKGHRAV